MLMKRKPCTVTQFNQFVQMKEILKETGIQKSTQKTKIENNRVMAALLKKCVPPHFLAVRSDRPIGTVASMENQVRLSR